MGVVMIYSATHNMALDRYHDAYFHLKKHLVSLFIGAVALVIASRTPLELMRKFTFPLLFLVFAMLVLLLIPGFGVRAGGAIRWLKVAGIRIGQPSELAKLALVLYLAHSMERKGPQIKEFLKGYVPHMVVAGAIVLLLMKQPDFGTSMMILSMTATVLFVGGVPMRFLFATAVSALPAVYLMLIWSPYRWRRITSFLDPMAKENIQDGAYQLVQSLKAFASGGLWGLGLGHGKQKLGYLPEAHTDFIFAVVGEELGLVGVLVAIGLILFVVYRGFRISLRCPTLFGRYLAFGLSCLIGYQTLINMGVVMGSLPTKGMPLPFLSFARSSLIVVLASIGILLQIEWRTRMAEEAQTQKTLAKRTKRSKQPSKQSSKRPRLDATLPDPT
jgi:cell division protein FtsW